MKKVIVVSKTHLDLGFTDFAAVIKDTYLNRYIPHAISLAEQLNAGGKKQFVWTTGSWILKEALRLGSEDQRRRLEDALRRGDIVPHALPFTTHTELLDADTVEYGLSIVEPLDTLRGRKTVAAKMTDVPGHTKGLVPLLAKHGVKLLHIGVNAASAVPEVPECFLWKCGDYEIPVIYSDGYGGALKLDLTEEVLYFDHTNDNRGTPEPEQIVRKLEEIQKEYPGYVVEAGTMDDFADVLWEKRHQLPVVTDEIGDTWIHGGATDPWKTGALRTLLRLKKQWLADGSLKRSDPEYVELSDHLLCVAEHTWGVDTKKHFADYEHYLKPDFQAARKAGTAKIHHPFRDFPQNLIVLQCRQSGAYKECSYPAVEKSWQEQRDYIRGALDSLSPAHRAQAEQALRFLRPEQPLAPGAPFDLSQEIVCGGWRLTLNRQGGVGSLSCGGREVLRGSDSPLIEYRSYDHRDYDFWIERYNRDLEKNISWVKGDFGRPLLQYVGGKYPAGRFPYTLKNAFSLEDGGICVDLACDPKLCEELGAPRLIQAVYRLDADGLNLELSWFGKDASRLTEALFLHLFPAAGTLEVQKLDSWVDPGKVVFKGNRNLHGVQKARLTWEGDSYLLENTEAPLLSVGRGKILEFDNQFEDMEKDGLTYVLEDNVWGTNFPLWYEENAAFHFRITKE